MRLETTVGPSDGRLAVAPQGKPNPRELPKRAEAAGSPNVEPPQPRRHPARNQLDFLSHRNEPSPGLGLAL